MREIKYRWICAIWFLSLGTACVPDLALEYETPRILALSPDKHLKPDQALTLKLVGTLEEDFVPMVRVYSSSSREWPTEIAVTEAAGEYLIRPGEPWPINDAMKAMVYGDPDTLIGEYTFSTGQGDFDSVYRLRVLGPEPGVFVPPNVQELVVEVMPVVPELRFVRFSSLDHELVAPVTQILSKGRFMVSIPDNGGACIGLCPRNEYEVSLKGVAPERQKTTRVQIGTLLDEEAPKATLRQMDVWGDLMRISIQVDEMAIASGVIWTADETPIQLSVSGNPGMRFVLESIESLKPNSTYQGAVTIQDFFGHETHIPIPSFETIGDIKVGISEVVATPLHDWSDNQTNGEAYDAYPGNGTVSHVDEWIELVNLSEEPIVIGQSGLYVRVLDSSPTETWLANASALRLGDGRTGNTWAPGSALVFRPSGSLNQTDFVIEVYSGRRRLDRLVIGDQIDSEHIGGRPPSLIHEALAKDAYGYWRWCEPTPGIVSLEMNCL